MNDETAEYKRALGKEKIAQASSLAGSGIKDIKGGMTDSVNESIAEAKIKASAQCEDAKATAELYASKAEAKIRANPLLSIGGAFLAGWAISKLLK